MIKPICPAHAENIAKAMIPDDVIVTINKLIVNNLMFGLGIRRAVINYRELPVCKLDHVCKYFEDFGWDITTSTIYICGDTCMIEYYLIFTESEELP